MFPNIPAVGAPAAPRGSRPSGTLKLKASPSSGKPADDETAQDLSSAAFYIDGFNLFHAIDDLNAPYLKWLDLWSLAEKLVRQGHEKVLKVVWCSAEYPYDQRKRKLHHDYRLALEAVGVTPELGHFVHETIKCRAECALEFEKPTEKAGDVNVAIHLIADGLQNTYDVAYLVTADSDQVATVKLFRKLLPTKQIIVVAPPGREHSEHLTKHANGKRSIKVGSIENSLFGKSVLVKNKPQIIRPTSYDPPPRWEPSQQGDAANVAAADDQRKSRKKRQKRPSVIVEKKVKKKLVRK